MVELALNLGNAPLPTEAAVSLTDFLAGANGGAVRVEPGEDARALLPHLPRLNRVDIAFPAFGDGRGYSSARVLREAGYQGPLVATGDVLVDQIGYLVRCGFDGFAPTTPLDAAGVKAALGRFPAAYQKASDPARPIWALRHG
jgi:uncharacterized protein (DUF934 family)